MSGVTDGRPCWFELGGTPTEDVLDFYATHLGWTYDVNPEVAGYRRAHAGGLKVAGFGGPEGPRPERGWRVYVGVDDLDDRHHRAIRAGATPLAATTTIADGRFAWLHHPLGGHLGLFESETDPGTTTHPGAGRVSGWSHESPDPEGVQVFHEAIFGPEFAILVDYQTGPLTDWIVRVSAEVDHLQDLQDPAGNRLRLEPGPSVTS